MIKHSLLIVFCTILIGCNSSTKRVGISEVLSELEQIHHFKFKGKGGGGGDMIDNLFKEARKKDNDLNGLHDEIQKVNKEIYKTLAPYRSYQNLQERYLRSMKGHVRSIKDSSLQKKANTNLRRLEAHFAKEKSAYKFLQNRLERKRMHLRDLTTLMKLQVTEKMMYDHFAKKKPASQQINSLESKLNNLQQRVKDRIK